MFCHSQNNKQKHEHKIHINKNGFERHMANKTTNNPTLKSKYGKSAMDAKMSHINHFRLQTTNKMVNNPNFKIKLR